MGSDRARINHETSDRRLRTIASLSYLWQVRPHRWSLDRPDVIHASAGKICSQRSATLFIRHVSTTSGRLRSTRCKWFDMIAYVSTSIPKTDASFPYAVGFHSLRRCSPYRSIHRPRLGTHAARSVARNAESQLRTAKRSWHAVLVEPFRTPYPDSSNAPCSRIVGGTVREQRTRREHAKWGC